MDRLSQRDSRAFRNGLLAGLCVLAGAGAGAAAAPSAELSCDPQSRGTAVLASVLARVTTPEQPLLRIGHRIARAVIARTLGGACD